MRVVAGEYGSRPLKAVPGKTTRPTSDKVKESMFNLLGHYFDGGVCLDFYGGSGGLAIEAVSRGMDQAVITERYRPAQETIEENIAMTKEEDKFHLLKGSNRQALLTWARTREIRFNLVLLDPPYAKQKIEEDILWLEDHDMLAENCQILCETGSDLRLPESLSEWTCQRMKEYGQTRLWLYERKTHDA